MEKSTKVFYLKAGDSRWIDLQLCSSVKIYVPFVFYVDAAAFEILYFDVDGWMQDVKPYNRI